MYRCIWFTLACLLSPICLSEARAQDEGNKQLPTQARAVVEKYCYRCHGNGRVEGGFDYVRSVKRLVDTGKIVPGDPAKSRLVKRMTNGSMPPEEDDDGTKVPLPSRDDIKIVQEWVKQGAADWDRPGKRDFIDIAKMYQFISDDLQNIAKKDQRKLPFMRYLTLTHLYNAGFADDELETYRLAINRLVNSLSKGTRGIIKTEPIDPAKTILRLDLRDYGWDATTWDALLQRNPYAVKYNKAAMLNYCAATTKTVLPDIRGDWFVFSASRPPLYHEILKIPHTVGELEKALGIDANRNIETDKVSRAGFIGSGVSQNNRLIERHDFQHGAYWKSYDFAGNLERQNLFAFPLGPHGSEGFQHDGGEFIFNLPNGLQGYMLADAKGKRLDKGPTNIVSDPKQPDRAVLNGVSCMSCHRRGIIDKADQIRTHVDKNLVAFAAEDRRRIRAIYPGTEPMDTLFKEDRSRFTEAAVKTGAKTNDKGELIGSDPVAVLSALFEADLDLAQVAAEVGVTAADFKQQILIREKLVRFLGALNIEGGKVKRQVYLQLFSEIVKELDQGEVILKIELPVPVIGPMAPVAGAEPKALGMKFARVPKGTFWMGGGGGKAGNKQVEIKHDFHLGAYEVTQEQWLKVMGNNPSQFSRNGEYKNDVKDISEEELKQFPVESVSWNDVQEFIKKLNAQEKDSGWVYRLPTEAEWEYACRGGATSQEESAFDFYFAKPTNSLSSKEANYGNLPAGGAEKGPSLGRTTKVGSYPANRLGLYDMHGNTWEWCQDLYEVGGSHRLFRGGSWRNRAAYCTAAYRNGGEPGCANGGLGFRLLAVSSGK